MRVFGVTITIKGDQVISFSVSRKLAKFSLLLFRMTTGSWAWLLEESLFEWIEKTGKWSEISVINKPLLEWSKNVFAKMLSSNVAVWEVIRVGRVIMGKNIYECKPSRNSPVFWWCWKLIKFKLKSPIIKHILFSLEIFANRSLCFDTKSPTLWLGGL